MNGLQLQGRLRRQMLWLPAVLFWLLLTGVSGVRAADSLQTADSVRRTEVLPLWNDSTLAASDTTAVQNGWVRRWLVPLGVALATGTAAYLLFTVRSR